MVHHLADFINHQRATGKGVGVDGQQRVHAQADAVGVTLLREPATLDFVSVLSPGQV